jgi:hypothetical protein
MERRLPVRLNADCERIAERDVIANSARVVSKCRTHKDERRDCCGGER